MFVVQNDGVPSKQDYHQSGQEPPKKPMKWPLVAIAVIVVVVLLIAVFFVLSPGNGTSGQSGIVSVEHDPQNPLPGDPITITVVVENSYLRDIIVMPYFEAMFTTDPGHFDEVSKGVYESTIGPYNDGSEIWYIIDARPQDGTHTYSYDNTIQVGNVERSSISTLAISDVQYFDVGSAYSVQANITSNATITHAYLVYYALEHFDDGSGAGTGGNDLMTANGNTYSGMMPSVVSASHSGGEITEAHAFFRIVVEDAFGNTAVSSPVHIILTGP